MNKKIKIQKQIAQGIFESEMLFAELAQIGTAEKTGCIIEAPINLKGRCQLETEKTRKIFLN